MLYGKNLGEHAGAMRSCETLAVLETDKGESAWSYLLINAMRAFVGGEACSKPSADGRFLAVGIRRGLNSNERALMDAYLQGFQDAMGGSREMVRKVEEARGSHMRARNPVELPVGAIATFGGMDFFDVQDEPEPEEVETVLPRDEEPQQLDASRLIKQPALALLDSPVVFFYRKNGLWAVRSELPANAEDALKVAEKIQRNLIPKSKLTSSDPYIEGLTLVLTYPSGQVTLSGKGAKAKDTSKIDLRASILRRAKASFGATGAALTGEAGAYTLELRPGLKHLRGKFSTQRVTRPSLEEIDDALTMATAIVEGLA